MNVDFSKFKSLSINGVALKELRIGGVLAWKEPDSYKNWVKYSTESDGVTIYNGGLGYKNGYRVRSIGEEIEVDNGFCTGFIPVKAGDVVMFAGWPFEYAHSANAINVSDIDFTNLGQFTSQPAYYGVCTSANSIVTVENDVYIYTVPDDLSISYIRVSGYGQNLTGENMIITINEEIT